MKNISPLELDSWIKKGKNFTLIDVREEWEHNAFNIGGQLIPQGELLSMKDKLPKDQDVVLYCAKGIRSMIMIQRLEQMGFSNLFNLEGGMAAWQRELGN